MTFAVMIIIFWNFSLNELLCVWGTRYIFSKKSQLDTQKIKQMRRRGNNYKVNITEVVHAVVYKMLDSLYRFVL